MATLDSGVPMVPAGEGSSGAGPSSGKKPKRFEIKKWNAVALWAWGKWILLLITVLFAETISWIFALSARRTRQAQRARSAQLLRGFATMHFTFTALADGSRPAKCVH